MKKPPSTRFWDAATRKQAAYATAAAILAATVGAVLENTWATPKQYLRLVAVREPSLSTRASRPAGTMTDTAVWRVENWGAEALDTLRIRIGSPECVGVRVVDGLVRHEGPALVPVARTTLHPQENVLDYLIPSWPREGVLVLTTVFQGTGRSRCYQPTVLTSSRNATLIISHAPRAVVLVRATPLLASLLSALVLLGMVGFAYMLTARRR